LYRNKTMVDRLVIHLALEDIDGMGETPDTAHVAGAKLEAAAAATGISTDIGSRDFLTENPCDDCVTKRSF
jgi:hypothetical protein